MRDNSTKPGKQRKEQVLAFLHAGLAKGDAIVY
jgi:hypothetical protein